MAQQPLGSLIDYKNAQYWNGNRAFEEICHAITCIKQYIGLWYKWGGDSPNGFDCSGLACEYLKSLGILSRRADMTAKSLSMTLPVHRDPKIYRPGDLCFYGASLESITHVEVAVTRYLSIGASGGGSKTLTEADAIRDRAFIKIRPIVAGRGGFPLQLFGDTQVALQKVFETARPLA